MFKKNSVVCIFDETNLFFFLSRDETNLLTNHCYIRYLA